jgi:CO dehydrogenase/acetyl-CoA synthase epsilon subunit
MLILKHFSKIKNIKYEKSYVKKTKNGLIAPQIEHRFFHSLAETKR